MPFSALSLYAPHAAPDLLGRLYECAAHALKMRVEKASLKATLSAANFDNYVDEYDTRSQNNWSEILWLMGRYRNQAGATPATLDGASVLPPGLTLTATTGTGMLGEMMDRWSDLEHELAQYETALAAGDIAHKTFRTYRDRYIARDAAIRSVTYQSVLAQIALEI